MSEFASFASAAPPHGASRGHRLGAVKFGTSIFKNWALNNEISSNT